MKKVLVTVPVTEDDIQRFYKTAPDWEFEFIDADRYDILPENVRDKNIILGDIPRSVVRCAEKLEWLQLNSAGTDGFCDGALPAGCILTNASGTYGLAISEHIIGMLLAIYKHLYIYYDHQKDGKWQKEGDVLSINGSNVLILGFGDIGQKSARLFSAFGANVRAVRRTKSTAPEYIEGLYLPEDVDDLLPWADTVLLSMPGTEATRHYLDRRRISLLKKDCVVLNVGRGILIDTEALMDALDREDILAAGLDVTDPEPIPEGHRLFRTRGLYFTPHVSGHYSLPKTLELIKKLFIRNISYYRNGLPMESLVDMETGYRIPSSQNNSL